MGPGTGGAAAGFGIGVAAVAHSTPLQSSAPSQRKTVATLVVADFGLVRLAERLLWPQHHYQFILFNQRQPVPVQGHQAPP